MFIRSWSQDYKKANGYLPQEKSQFSLLLFDYAKLCFEFTDIDPKHDFTEKSTVINYISTEKIENYTDFFILIMFPEIQKYINEYSDKNSLEQIVKKINRACLLNNRISKDLIGDGKTVYLALSELEEDKFEDF